MSRFVMTVLMAISLGFAGCGNGSKAKASRKAKSAEKAMRLRALPQPATIPDLKLVAKDSERLQRKWREECMEEKKEYINVIYCIRWAKLFKDYLSVDYVEEVMLIRFHVGIMILRDLGQELCEEKARGSIYEKGLIKKELRAIHSNMKELIRKIREAQSSIKERVKSRVTIPDLWYCRAPKEWVLKTK